MRKGCSAAPIADTRSPSAASCRCVRCAAASPGEREPGGHSLAVALEPKQPLHLMPHGDAQVHAERKQDEDDQPEANVRRAALACAALAVLSLRPLAAIFAADGAGVVDRHVRWLPSGLSHPRQFSGPTGNIRLLPGPRSRCARVHARPCQGCQPCLRTIAASGLVLATQEAGNVTGQATGGPTGDVRRLRAPPPPRPLVARPATFAGSGQRHRSGRWWPEHSKPCRSHTSAWGR